jgi:hypothetical protein
MELGGNYNFTKYLKSHGGDNLERVDKYTSRVATRYKNDLGTKVEAELHK